MRQILYVSLSMVPDDKTDLASIREQSRHNNAIDGITGLLWSDGKSFMQVLEGPRASVTTTFARILADTRHHSLVVLQERRISVAEFGSWTMAHRHPCDAADSDDAQLQRLLINASDQIRMHFLTLIASGHVAALALPIDAIGASPPTKLDGTGDPARPRRPLDRRVGAPFHNAGVALNAAFAQTALPAHAPHDACLEDLRRVARIPIGDSSETAHRRDRSA
ncbi:BLUF domain-containing protein [Sphingomonas sp. UYP23]